MRLLVVAAYASVRAGLHAILSEIAEAEILGTLSGSAELERVLVEARPDVVVWDANEEDRVRILELVVEQQSGLVALGEVPVDFLTRGGDALPAWAYLRKEADSEEIVQAVQAVAVGLVVLDRSFVSLLTSAVPLPAFRPNAGEDWEHEQEHLTAREREVLQLMALGLPNKIIAARLSISLHTVKYHVAAILAKLGAASRTEAVTLGARRGYVLL
jgi:DNA-binding NarL/FixJ family response regulator